MAGESIVVSSNPQADAFSGLRSFSSCPVQDELKLGSLGVDVAKQPQVVEQPPPLKLLASCGVFDSNWRRQSIWFRAVASAEAAHMSCKHLLELETRAPL
jgi:hypothetical protein